MFSEVCLHWSFFKRQEYMFYGHGMEWKWMHTCKIFFNAYFWEWDLGSDERIYPDPVCLQFVHVLLALKKKKNCGLTRILDFWGTTWVGYLSGMSVQN